MKVEYKSEEIEFKPRKIEITLESLNEVQRLWLRMNLSIHKVLKYTGSMPQWVDVDKIKKDNNFDLFDTMDRILIEEGKED